MADESSSFCLINPSGDGQTSCGRWSDESKSCKGSRGLWECRNTGAWEAWKMERKGSVMYDFIQGLSRNSLYKTMHTLYLSVTAV